MRFTISGKVYEASSVDRISLANILKLEREAAELGRPLKWSQFKNMVNEASALSAEELDDYDETPWIIALTIWASRLNAGENVTFAQAVDFPLADLQWIPDPQDHKEPANPTKSPKASAGDAKRARAPKVEKTSATPSSPA